MGKKNKRVCNFWNTAKNKRKVKRTFWLDLTQALGMGWGEAAKGRSGPMDSGSRVQWSSLACPPLPSED